MTSEATGPREGLGRFLRSHQDEIVTLWMKRVQEIFPARALSAPILVDHIPVILDFLADSVSAPAEASRPGDHGRKSHAVERLARGYDLEDVIREYTLLRQTILDLWEREAGEEAELMEVRRLQDAIEQSISESAARYARQRERVLRALDRLSEVVFDAADDLDRLFELLLHTALEAMEAVDNVVILLRDGDVLRVRAAAGLDEAATQYSIRVGEGFAGKIAAEGQPHFVRSTDEPIVSGPMRGQGVRALYGVPLISNGRVIGVAHMGSRTSYEYADEDKLLFDTLARRAAMLIQNALLAARDRAYNAAARAFGRAASLSEAVVVLLPELGNTLGWDVGAFWRVDPKTQHLELLRFWQAGSIETEEFERVSRSVALSCGRGLPGKAWEAGGPVYVAEFAEAERFPRSSAARAQGLRTALAFPIKVEDTVVGVVELLSRSMRWSSDEGVHLTTLIAQQLGQFTRRIAAQEELRKSSAQNAAILDAALDCVVAMDAGGRVAGWNKSAEQTFGFSRAEAMGRDMADLIIPPRLRAAHRLGLARYLATGQQQLIDRRVEVSAMRRDGSEFPIELAISQLQGEEPPLFTGFIRDISKNKEAERERMRLLDEVTRSRDAQRFLSDSSKELAASLDYKTTLAKVARLAVPGIADWCAVDVVEDGRLRRVSAAHVDPAKVELVRDIVRRYPPDETSPSGAHEVMRTGRGIVVNEIPDELLARDARGPEHLQLIRALGLKSYISTPIMARGSALGVITLVKAESGGRYAEADVLLAEELALRAAAAIENARLYSEAQTAIHTREDVLAVVAHDLRNPLGTISMSANVLAMRLPEDRTRPGALRRQIEIIHRAADRMERLIGDLLDMASIQAGRLSITLDTTDIGALLEEAFETHEPLAMEAGIALRKELDLEGLQARWDRGRVLQALGNLLGNAIKFCGPGDTVSLRAARCGDAVEITVADTGRGIERGDFDKIFQPYMAIRRERKRGTGLGLYITKGIIEAHGGRITFESEVGAGTAFYLSLPLVEGGALE